MGIDRAFSNSEPAGRRARAEDLRQDSHVGIMGIGTLACPRCDAPIAPGPRPMTPTDAIACPICAHGAPAGSSSRSRPRHGRRGWWFVWSGGPAGSSGASPSPEDDAATAGHVRRTRSTTNPLDTRPTAPRGARLARLARIRWTPPEEFASRSGSTVVTAPGRDGYRLLRAAAVAPPTGFGSREEHPPARLRAAPVRTPRTTVRWRFEDSSPRSAIVTNTQRDEH